MKSNQKSDLGNRMKTFYEDRFRISLPRRTNVVIRIDGKSFHTYTNGLKKPFDKGLMEDMDETARFLCENIQGAKMGYVQSDEISILLTDYDEQMTDAWFDYNLQKMVSISASIATAKFNSLRRERFEDQRDGFMKPPTLAMFDARAAVIPSKKEVVNYFIWRQQDCTTNSIAMAAQSMFSHSALNGKNSSNMQDMMLQKGVNWDDYPNRFKRGGVIVKKTSNWAIKIDPSTGKVVGNPWVMAENNKMFQTLENNLKFFVRSSWESVSTPIFTQDREFVLKTFNK